MNVKRRNLILLTIKINNAHQKILKFSQFKNIFRSMYNIIHYTIINTENKMIKGAWLLKFFFQSQTSTTLHK